MRLDEAARRPARAAIDDVDAAWSEDAVGAVITVSAQTAGAALVRAARCALRIVRSARAAGGAAAAGVAADPEVASRLAHEASAGQCLLAGQEARQGGVSLRVRLLTRSGGGVPEGELYEIAGTGPRRAPDEGAAPRLMAPFVGRQDELETILSAVESARGGSGAAVLVTGAPGIGKSRLVFEVRRRLPAREVTYLEGRCAPYGRGVPLLPVLDVLRDNCGIDADDAQPTITAKVRGALEELELPADDAPYLLRLLGDPQAAGSLEGISAEAVRARTLHLLREMALRGSRRRPLVLVLEDLHWADVTTLDFLHGLLPELSTTPMLVVATHRSGLGPSGAGPGLAPELRLGPLAEPDASSIVRRVAGARAMDDAVLGAVLDRGDGNPLYLEELGRSLRDSVRRELPPGAPTTLEGLIRARLTRLASGPRRTLETASVIGRRFERELLLAVASPDADADASLASLVAQEFLHEETGATEELLAFDHALVQDAVYRSVPGARRRDLHAAVAEQLSRRAAGREEQVMHQLAHHWSKAERARQAVDALIRSGELSARGYAHAEANAALERAAVHGEALPPDERTAALRDIAVRRANSLYFLGRVRESVALLSAVDGATPAGDDVLSAAEIQFWLAHGHSHLGEPERADLAARAAAELGGRAGSMSVLGRARYVLAREGWWTGRWKEGIAEGEAAVPLLEETEDAWWLGHCLCYIGHGHRSLGRFDEALAAAGRARGIGDASGDPRVRSFSGWSRGWYLAVMGRSEEAIEACEEAIAVSPDPANSAWALGFLGFAHAEDGQSSRAVDEISRAIADVRRADHPRVQCWFEGWLADAQRSVGLLHDARATARSALVTSRRVECRWAEAHATRSLGRIALTERDLPAAVRLLAGAAAGYARLDGKFDHAVTLLDVALAARAAGDAARAAEAADSACRLFAQMPVPRWQERAAEAAAASPR